MSRIGTEIACTPNGPTVSIATGGALLRPSSSWAFGQSQTRTGLTPPTYFLRSVKKVQSAHLLWTSYSTKLPSSRGHAQRRGHKLEAQVISKLGGDPNLRGRMAPGLALQFVEANAHRGKAVPDILLWSSNWQELLCIEVKLSHSADAWYQLNSFYLPILKRALPAFRVRGMEICKFYDPDVKLPQDVAFVHEVDEAFEIRECFHPVLIWK